MRALIILSFLMAAGCATPLKAYHADYKKCLGRYPPRKAYKCQGKLLEYMEAQDTRIKSNHYQSIINALVFLALNSLHEWTEHEDDPIGL